MKIDLLAPELRSALRQPGEAVATTTFTVRGRFHSQWLLHFAAAGNDGCRELVVLAADDVREEAARHFQLKPVRVGFSERVYAVCPGCEKTTRMLFARPSKRRFWCKRCAGIGEKSRVLGTSDK